MQKYLRGLRMRFLLTWSSLLLLGFLLLAGATACGSTGSPLRVSILPVTSGSLQAGNAFTFKATIHNTSTSQVDGVGLSVALPADSRYRSTVASSDALVSRVSPIDPQINSSNPVWGTWSLGPAGSSSDTLTVEFTIAVAGSPGSYPVTAYATGGTATVTSTRTVQVVGQPNYQVGLAATPGTASAGSTVAYAVTIINTGHGDAQQVEILLNLPPGVQYVKTLHIAESAGVHRTTSYDPPPGSEEVFFGNWSMPGVSNVTGSSTLTIEFEASILPDAKPGKSYVTGQLTDGADAIIPIVNAAELTVTPASSPSASPAAGNGSGSTPGPSESPLPSGAATEGGTGPVPSPS